MKWLNAVTNVLLLAAVGYALVVSNGAAARNQSPTPAVLVGEALPPIPGWDYEHAQSTLIMVLRSACRFCTESLPLYAEIVKRRDAVGAALKVVAVSLDDQATLDRYLDQHGVHVDRSVSIVGSKWRPVMSTPTLLLVDSRGEVRRIWVGKLSADRERALLDDLVLPRDNAQKR